MERALVASSLAVTVIAVASLLRRHRRPTAGTDPGSHGWELPRAIAVDGLPIPRHHPASGPASDDRTDDPTDTGPATTVTPRWWMVTFTSATCRTCARTWELVRAVAEEGSGAGGDDVIAVEVEYSAHRGLHQRYGIEAVPAVAICNRDGDVARWLLGPVSSAELAGALAGARAAAADHGASVTIRRPIDPVRPHADGDPT